MQTRISGDNSNMGRNKAGNVQNGENSNTVSIRENNEAQRRGKRDDDGMIDERQMKRVKRK